jgi:predicted PhzF superfamily epimerase YddE/YHI9
MAKMNRERAVKERRARKQEKKDEKKQAAAREAETGETTFPAPTVDEETGG